MNRHLAALAIANALPLAGCMIVPPFSSPVSPKVSGRVLDESNMKPIHGAMVRTERAGYVREARTSVDGTFVVPSARQWHYLVYLGSPGFYPTPWVFGSADKDLHLSVEAAGYGRLNKDFIAGKSSFWNVTVPGNLELKMKPE